MKKLTNVYIKVNKSNHQWLSELFDSSSLGMDTYIDFYTEDYRCKFYYSSAPKDKQKVSLSQLKRLIDTIPTREEITRLKRQISAYKTNYDRAVKHSLSKEDVIDVLRNTINQMKNDERKYVEKTNKDYNELSNMYFNKINEIERLKYDFEQLKQRKWWQIWK